MIPVACPCGKNLNYTPEFAGKRVKCPKCGGPIQVPKDEKRPNVRTCKAHPESRAVGTCAQCRAPICSDCRAAFGYYCSEACKSTSVRVTEPILAPEEKVTPAERARSASIAKALKIGVLALVAVLVVGFGIWLVKKITFKGGQTAWTADLGGEYARDLFVRDGTLYLITGNGKVVRYDPAGGSVLGETPGVGESSWIVARTDDVIVMGNPNGLTALSLADGKVLWKNTESRWNILSLSGWESEEKNILEGGRLYVREFDPEVRKEKPTITALDVKSGGKIWSQELSTAGWAQTVRAGAGKVCVAIGSGLRAGGSCLVLLDASTGKELWTREIGVHETLRITDKGILVLSSEGLRLHSFADGQPVWELPLDARRDHFATTHLWLEKGSVYLHFSGLLARIDLADGKVRWRAVAPPYVYSFAAAGSGILVSGYAEENIKQKLADPDVPLMGKKELKEHVMKELPEISVTKPVLYSFDPENGRVLWTQMNRGGQVQPAGDFILSWGGSNAPNLLDMTKSTVQREVVRLIDPSNGDAIWEFETDSIATPFVVVGKRVFFARSLAGHSTADSSTPLPDRARESKLIAVYLK